MVGYIGRRMGNRIEAAFIDEHSDALRAYWNRFKDQLVEWRAHYQWPPGTATEKSLNSRELLSEEIRTELGRQGYLSKTTFDNVMQWGFRTDSGCSDEDVRKATGLAFSRLKASDIAQAARELVRLPRIGISRATKILALSDQFEFGIYDSRSAHGLSGLVDRAGRRIIAIPQGRVIAGDPRNKDGYCRAFEEYIWVLRHLRTLAREDASLGAVFTRAADLEMALFMKSRNEKPAPRNPHNPVPKHLRTISELDEENAFWTLGPGRKSKVFWAIFGSSEVTILTGEKKTPKTLKAKDTDTCLAHFARERFPLSNSKTAKDRDPRGLGEYFCRNFGSSVFASHFAALWVHQGLLEATWDKGAWWLRVRDRAVV
jgi:hypothetical protein